MSTLVPAPPYASAPHASRWKVSWKRVGAGAALVVIALIGGMAAARNPLLAIVGAVGVIAIVAAIRHLTGAVALLCASFYFDGYLTGGGTNQALTGTKLIGGLVVLAWFVNWAIDRRPFLNSSVLVVLGGFGTWVVLSAAAARDEAAALTTTSRYLFAIAVVFLLIQEVGQDRRRADLFVTAMIVAGGVAGAFGTISFLFGGAERATGPIADPNDFGLVLAATLPLVMVRLSKSVGRRTRFVAGICGISMILAILATFSRGAAVGLAVGLVWAVVTRRIPLRWFVGLVVLVVTVAGLAYLAQPKVIDEALNRKEHIAGSNVNSRLNTWDVAIKEFKHWPVLGVGPGNYRDRFRDFKIPEDLVNGPLITHNALLSILAVLGLPGFLLFFSFLALSFWKLRLRTPDDPALDRLRMGLAASLLIATAGAFFLDAQYLPSMYLAAGLGAGLSVADRRSVRSVDALV